MAMRIWLAALALVAAWPAGAQAPPSPPGRAAPAPALSPAPATPKAKSPATTATVPAQKPRTAPGQAAGVKVIKDPAEHNAYIHALRIGDPRAKAVAMEAFAAKYPASVVRVDALEQAMAAHQQAGDPGKVEEAANAILGLQPNNVRALAIVTVLRRARATQGDGQALADVLSGAELGLQALPLWSKPPDLPDEAFARLRKQMTAIFSGAIGFAALQAKDYAKARVYYQMAFAADPSSLQDVYQLAIAELQMEPIDVNGLWHIVKAMNLADGNEAARQSIASYGKARYRKYHGGEDGWDELVGQISVSARLAPPADFARSITPAPSPAELAVRAVGDNDPATLSFSDWEFVLSQRDASPANRDAAAKVWQAIQAKQKNGTARLKIPMKVVAATADTIQAAITEENRKDDRVDVLVVMKAPVTSPPAAGATVDVVGLMVDYLPSPFAFIMRDGELAAAK